MRIQEAEAYILELLQLNLPKTLYYHGLHHVLDVVSATAAIADSEGVKDEETLNLLRTAALYHDSGFLNTYAGHEQAGCKIVRDVLPGFGYRQDQIVRICGMIMATKIPQSPQNLLEEILADADLDYLGRDDFEPISGTLFLELKGLNLVQDIEVWNKIQVSFLRSHHYWTNTAQATRNGVKQQHLDKLLRSVETAK